MSNEETLFQSDDQQNQAQQASRLGAPSLEGYQLQQKLGTGAFGEVWGGTQNSTGQRVAVKFFLQRNSCDLDYIRRELERLREVCDHPAVVGLIDADLEHQPAYFVMPWLARSLDQWAGTPSAQQAGEWLKQLAQGLQHTHEKGLLHCDLKPSNVMLDEADLVRLADFGQSRQQGEGVVAWGTLGYMAPEQALLGSEAAGSAPSVRWDVYGLGATFYRVLTGRCPYLSDSQLMELQALPLEERLPTYRQILLTSRLPSARSLNREVDEDLSDLLQACLRPDPERRLGGMALLLQDLERRRRGQALLCRQPWSAGYRMGKWARQPALVVSALLATALLAGGVAAYRHQQNLLDHQTRLLVAMLSERGNERLRQGYGDEASLWLATALEKMPDQINIRRALAWADTPLVDFRPGAHGFSYHPAGNEMVFRTREGNFYFASSGKKLPLAFRWTGQEALYSPTGRYLALLCEDGRSAMSQLAILLYDCQSGQLVGQPLLPGEDGNIVHLSFDAKERLVSFHPRRSRICRWSMAGQLEWSGFLQSSGKWAERPDPLVSDVSVAFSRDGRWLLAGMGTQSTYLIDLEGGPARLFSFRFRSLLDPFSGGSEWLLLGDGSRPEVLNLASQQVLKPEGGTFGCFVGASQVALIKGDTLQVGPLLPGGQSYRLQHGAAILRAICSDDGKRLLSQTEGGMLWLWDLATHSLVCSKPGRNLDYFGFVGEGQGFFSKTNGLHQWAIRQPEPRWRVSLGDSNVVSLKVEPGQRWLLARQPRTLTVLSPEGKGLARFDSPTSLKEALISRSGLVALESQGAYSLLWNLPGTPREQILGKLARPEADLFSNRLAFSRQGDRLAVAGTSEIELWNTLREPAVRLGTVSCPNAQAVAISPDGKWLAALSGLDLLETAEWRLWSLPELSPATIPAGTTFLRAQPGLNTQLQFDPSGSWLLARNSDAYATFSIPKGENLASWNEGSWLTQATMAPDGSRLFQPKSQGLGEFRSLPQGKRVGQPLEPGSENQFAYTACFSAESDLCALASPDKVTLYDPTRAYAIRSLPCRDPFACVMLKQPARLLVGNKHGQVECWAIPVATGSAQDIRRRWEGWTGMEIDEETASVRSLSREEWLARRP